MLTRRNNYSFSELLCCKPSSPEVCLGLPIFLSHFLFSFFIFSFFPLFHYFSLSFLFLSFCIFVSFCWLFPYLNVGSSSEPKYIFSDTLGFLALSQRTSSLSCWLLACHVSDLHTSNSNGVAFILSPSFSSSGKVLRFIDCPFVCLNSKLRSNCPWASVRIHYLIILLIRPRPEKSLIPQVSI